MRSLTLACLLISAFSISVYGESGKETFSAEQIEFFEKEIRPVLVESCLDCHTGAKARIGLELDHRAGWLRGSDYRKIINPENVSDSVILHAVKQTGKHKAPKMPEKGAALSPAAIENLEKWIAQGLPWPEETDRKRAPKGSKHWSFQSISKIELPEGVGHPIDYFIKKAQKEKGVAMAPKADRRTLYRRLSYGLTGLPPKYDEVQAFVDNPESFDTLWPKTIETLLESPHYGERWARHWMDIARYADTKGYEAGGKERRFVYSYTYRDWLIRAFNEDLPFDQFLLYQLAADKMVKDWNGPERHHLAAMGFISLSKNGAQELVLDDRVDTTFRGMMGLTVSCARCHDHKFDPVSTKEYYSLFGIFKNSMETRQPTIEDPPNTPEYQAYLAELGKLQKAVEDFWEPHLAEAAKAHPKLAKDKGRLKSMLGRDIRKKAGELQIKVDKFVANKEMEPAKALVVTDRAKPFTQKVYIRGNPSRQGDLAPPQFLKAATPNGEPAVFKEGSGRLEMAHEIASADNPLTARVIVNRVWMWHFGEGIVRTVSDFGTQGEKPDHPELLDWLATWFVDNGWSIKKLHQLILTSDVWQQSSSNPDANQWMLVDSENRLLWKSFRRRLDFEQMRDSILDVAGNLDDQMFGRTEKILEPPFSKRRTIYGFIDRQNLPTVFRHFDFSNPQETTGQRQKTTIPMQALFTLNSPFVMNQAASLSRLSEKSDDRVEVLHRAVFGKEPTAQDRQLAESFINGYASDGEKDRRQNLSGWSYGWGGIDEATGQVNYQPFEFWDAKTKIWRVRKEYPIKDSKLSYLSISKTRQHPGLGPEYCSILRWHAPRKMKVGIDGEVERPAVNLGRSGLKMTVVSSKRGILKTVTLPVSERSLSISVDPFDVEEGEIIYFVTDCDRDTSHDSFTWDPIVYNAANPGDRWKMSVDFAGPETPLTAWEAYAQALLNTNRFLFIQ